MRTCPKCNYIRKETDSCPEWQCPSCQVAYNKAADLQGLGTYHTAVGNNTRSSVNTSANSSSNAWKWVVLALILAGVSLQSYSSWKKSRAHRASVSQLAATSQPVITLYGTTWCGYCAAAREFFNTHGIAYKDLDVEKSNEGYQAYKTLGVQGIPAIVIGDDLIEGFDEDRVRKKLEPWLRKS